MLYNPIRLSKKSFRVFHVNHCSWLGFSFFRFPQQDTPLLILGSGIILGLLFRMGPRAVPALFMGFFVYHFQLIGYKFLVSLWLSSSMLITGWLALLYLRRFFSDDLTDRPVHNYLHFYVAAILIFPISNLLLDLPLVWLIDRLDIIEDIRLIIFSYNLVKLWELWFLHRQLFYLASSIISNMLMQIAPL